MLVIDLIEIETNFGHFLTPHYWVVGGSALADRRLEMVVRRIKGGSYRSIGSLPHPFFVRFWPL